MKSEYVILLHGLCRTSRSMRRMESALASEGYIVLNIDYPSRTAQIDELSERAIGPALTLCAQANAPRVHFVTHSMGGILVRSYLSRHPEVNIGRTVMLAPPNQGSEVVDRLRSWKFFRHLNGPAASELGTDADSVPNLLGPAVFELGVIAGSRSINLINSLFIDGADDGKVSVSRTMLEGMSDHIVLKVTHPFIMQSKYAISQTVRFLKTGNFERASSSEISPN